MKFLITIYLAAAIIIAGASENDTEKVELENGFILLITESTHSRNMPYLFYDQAIKSIPRIHPNSIIVAEERLGKTGINDDILYSLIGYKVAENTEEVTISGIATNRDRAWSFNIMVTDSFLSQTLLLILQQLNQLPNNKRMQLDKLPAAPSFCR